ncbi:MAG: hypothetical protein AAF585_18240 [Verrucomicrobiota bacterium]
MNNEVKLTLTIEETNLILEGLGSMPFVRVHDLVYKIRQQADPQLSAAPAAAEDTKEE